MNRFMQYAALALLTAALCGFVGFGIMAELYKQDMRLVGYCLTCAMLCVPAFFLYLTEKELANARGN